MAAIGREIGDLGLHRTQIGTGAQGVTGEGVAQRVRTGAVGDAGWLRANFL